MAKIRLSNERRTVILDYMHKHFDASQDRSTESVALDTLIEKVNAAIRAKFPEKDMIVLRRYGFAVQDICLKFSETGGRFFGVEFDYDDRERLADVPSRRGCQSSDVFAMDEGNADLAESWKRLKDERKKVSTAKRREYYSFLERCKTVEDVLEVVPLPEDLLKKLGQNANALVAVSDETIAMIRGDFAAAA